MRKFWSKFKIGNLVGANSYHRYSTWILFKNADGLVGNSTMFEWILSGCSPCLEESTFCLKVPGHDF